jgi:hypothetical protein
LHLLNCTTSNALLHKMTNGGPWPEVGISQQTKI